MAWSREGGTYLVRVDKELVSVSGLVLGLVDTALAKDRGGTEGDGVSSEARRWRGGDGQLQTGSEARVVWTYTLVRA